MKLVRRSVFVLMLFVSILGFQGVFGQSTTSVDITLTSVFDGNEITSTLTDVSYGSSIMLDSSIADDSGHTFLYWVVNDVIEEGLSVNYNFIVKNQMSITAIFSPSNKHVVLFRDVNGVLLDTQFVADGLDATDAGITLPSKPGLVVSSNKWNKALTNITEDTIITLQYDVDASSTFDLTVTNGSTSGNYNFNQEVTITADAAPIDQNFSHWEEDGQIISRNSTEVITILSDRTISAVYTTATVSDAPFVSIGEDLAIRGGYASYIGHYYMPSEFTLLEYGMISFDTDTFDLSTVGVTIHQATKINPTTNEYLMSFNTNNYVYVRGYLIFKDTEGDIVEIYSDTKAASLVLTETLNYSTGFEDMSKGSYAVATATSNGQTWTLDEALVGSLAGDLVNDVKSVRIKSGELRTEFTMSTLTKVSFYYGTYGSDDDSTFDIEISTDKTTWHTLDSSILSSGVFQYYEFELTDTVYTNLGLDKNDAYYFRFTHASTERLNLDDVKFYSMENTGGTNPTADNTKQSNMLSMTLPSGAVNTITVGDSYTGTCSATDLIIGSVNCSVVGTPNTASAGDITVTFTATDYEGIVYTDTVTVTIEPVNIGHAYLQVDYIGYLDGIEGLYGDALQTELRTIITASMTGVSYGDARTALGVIDADPNVSGNILTIYTRQSIDSTWDSGITWNREHVWPNSRLGVPSVTNTTINIASDLHNLRACISSVNSSRSNKVFDATTTSETYYPGADDSGDVARILFYMETRYATLELTDTIYGNEYFNYTPEGAKMSVLTQLLLWNASDPVDTFESNRNNAIETYQGNRNPFIDYPYLADLIWYQETGILD